MQPEIVLDGIEPEQIAVPLASNHLSGRICAALEGSEQARVARFLRLKYPSDRLPAPTLAVAPPRRLCNTVYPCNRPKDTREIDINSRFDNLRTDNTTR